MNPESLLKEFISVSSVSGEEVDFGKHVYSLLQSFFKVKKIPVAGDRFNILAAKGKPKIYFNTHLDTVPVGNAKLKEDKDKIYGRGACDAKGSMSAMICAAINLKERGIKDFGLFFNVGEESDFIGIKAGLPEKNPPFVLIGEPTELRPCIGQKGLCGFNVVARGRSAHGATPEMGISAINKIVEAVNKLNAINFPSDDVLGKTAINIGIIEGGTRSNVVPDYAKINVELRTVKEIAVYKKILEKELNAFEIEYLSCYDPKIINDKKIIGFAEFLTNQKSFVKNTFTELYFWPRGIILGPGSTLYAHTDEEHIAKTDLHRAVKVYEDFVTNFIGSFNF